MKHQTRINKVKTIFWKIQIHHVHLSEIQIRIIIFCLRQHSLTDICSYYLRS